MATRTGHDANPLSRDRPAAPDHRWRTALTHVERNRILLRGYAVDELMGRVTFAEAVYLLLVGELPPSSIGRMMEALLVSSLDHGSTPPSTLAARNVATTGAPLRASVAAGVLAFGQFHGGDIELCMAFLDAGLTGVRNGMSYDEAATTLVREYRDRGERIPGFGHRLHDADPRAARLFQMALELEVDGPCLHLVRAVDRTLNLGREGEHRIPVNVDGAIAAVCGDMGLPPPVGTAMFIISRVPGLIAHAHEEAQRERRMRQIDSTRAEYDGPAPRRVPERRKDRW